MSIENINHHTEKQMPNNTAQQFNAVIEQCSKTNVYVGYIPGFPGAHSQGDTIEELMQNLEEVVSMLLQDSPELESHFVGTRTLSVH